MVTSLTYSSSYKIHYLKDGETLWRVSQNYNISLDLLCKVNNISDASRVKKGAKLKIPLSDSSAATGYRYHYLEEGETLWRVSQNYQVSLELLCKVNNISDATKVKKGTKLKIPTSNNLSTPVSTTKKVTTQQNTTTTNTTPPPQNGKIYLDYAIPLQGSIKPFVTAHFRGLLIFTNNKESEVRAAASGKVTYVDRIRGYGIVVSIRHPDGYTSTYSGFKEIYVKHGDTIAKGETIGLAGTLSRYEKPGLLFSLIYNKQGVKFDMEYKRFYITRS